MVLYLIFALFFRILEDMADDAELYIFCKVCKAMASADMPVSYPLPDSKLIFCCTALEPASFTKSRYCDSGT